MNNPFLSKGVRYEIYITVDPTKLSSKADDTVNSLNSMYKELTGEDIGLKVTDTIRIGILVADRELTDEELIEVQSNLPSLGNLPDSLRDTVISTQLELRKMEEQEDLF